MYAFYKQLHPPTGVEQCVYCHFLSGQEKNLVTAGVNQLNVYRLHTEQEAASKSQDPSPDSKSRKQKLECVASFQLFGNVQSMQNVRLNGPRDALLLSFKEARLSLVEYDPSTHDLKTSSLHCFEEEELKDGHLQQDMHVPLVRVDPEGRCAAMLIYGTRLVILPFRREAVSEEGDGSVTTGKSPIMSSYVIDLRKLDEKVINILDFQFLHGYYEPTVFILHEPLPTWAGRVAVRRDSCSIVAISLNIIQRAHPIIWSLGNLPFDCSKAFAVPKPIGGTLVFAANSLLYLNQSFPPYGVSVNSLTNQSSDFLLKTQESMKIALDCAQAAFLSYDKLVISLRGGELYVLTLMVDTSRAVRSFHLDKAAASVLTTCMCVVGSNYLFLGSRLGNSLLLRYTEKSLDVALDASVKKDKAEEPAAKKKKTDALGDWIATDVSQLDDLDELEMYGTVEAQSTGSQITQYMFEVCDSIMNIGPCAQLVMGEPAFLSEEFSNTVDPDVELVTTSGYGKNGAISVLQRTIRPQVVTTFELPQCTDMWTVLGGDSPPQDHDSRDQNYSPEVEDGHAYLILCREGSTMILQTGQEIMELDHSGFNSQGVTVHACNIGNNKYILQVSDTGLFLLQGATQVQHLPVDVGSVIISCSVADPYILLLTEDGQLLLFMVKQDLLGPGMRLTALKHHIHQNSSIVTMCAYKDTSGVFTTETQELQQQESSCSTKPAVEVTLETSTGAETSTLDDEDELLYGESQPAPTLFSTGLEKKTSVLEDIKKPEMVKPTFWAALARENGVLEVYSMPDFRLCFLVNYFPAGHRVLVDSGQLTEQTTKSGAEGKASHGLAEVKELMIVGLGSSSSRPYLLARVEDELLIYEAFPFHASTNAPDDHLKLRFKKVPHGLIVKEKKVPSRAKMRRRVVEDGEDGGEEDDDAADHAIITKRWFRAFGDISGYSGVFVCGPYPHWLFMSYRGVLRMHPMAIDGSVTCFAPFHNVNCPRGFLYFNRQGEMRISVLPTHLSYDAPWPVRKVPLRCTPHHLAYHTDSKTYSVCSSVSEPCNRLVKVAGEGEKEFETVEKDDRFIYPCIDKFNIQLFSPVSWEPIPNTKLDLEDFEHVTTIKHVNLKSEGTMSGYKGYMAVSTTSSYNEEIACRGRILIYDVIEVVPEPGQPLTKNKMKMEYNKEQKGPVSTLDSVQGFLVAAIGQKIYIWQLKDQDLIGVAFIDTQIYIHSMCVIKNLILAADVWKSVSLLRYQTDMKVLSLVSRDVKPLEVYSVAFLVDNTTLSFLVSDRMNNFLVYAYQPEVRESHGGQRLLRRADLNVGSHVNAFFRVRCKLSDPSTPVVASGPVERRHSTYFATLDGSLGFVLPITEKLYRRMLMLQNALTVQIPHLAGLNPRSYRHVRHEYRTLSNPHRNIVDGDLLWKFLHLSSTERSDIAHKIGITPQQIVDDLMEVDRLTAHF